MMVTIHRKGKTMRVPASAYPLIYEPAGWRRLGAEAESENHAQKENLQARIGENMADDTMPENGNFEPENANFEQGVRSNLDELLEIPLSEMSSEQLKEVAMELGINISGIKTKGELRRIVAEHLEG